MKANVICPDRDLDRLENERECKRQCNTVSDCKGSRKKCICDDLCGMSCINPNATCKLQESFENGDIAGDRRIYGTTITYNCNEGFILNGNKRRTCRSDRKWSGTPPTCYAGCQAPTSRSTSAFPDATKDEYRLGEEVPYVCQFGYQLSGIAVATCIQGGRWKLSKFQCAPKNCGDPGTIRNGYKSSGDEYTFGKRVFFSCNQGYELVGRGFLSCNTEGEWQPKKRPTCEIVECGVPIAPEHGSVDMLLVDAFVYLARVSYSCEPGYKLVGNSFGICNENQTWGELPTCQVNDDCDFENGIEPTCNYKNDGWSRILTMNTLESRRGFVIMTDQGRSATLLSSVLRRSKLCLSFHYKISGLDKTNHFIVYDVESGRRNKVWEVYRTDRNDEWLSTDVLLPATTDERKIEFAALTSTDDSQVAVDNIVISEDEECVDECDGQLCKNGATCLNRIDDYECVCPYGYEGKNCSQQITCDVRRPPVDGYLPTHQTQVSVRGNITYKCYEGYRISGQATLQCRSDKTWSASVPECVAQTCSKDSVPSNVQIQPTKPNWIPGDKVTYSCKNDNYELIGIATATCRSSGQWSNSNVLCQALSGARPCPPGYVWNSPYCFKLASELKSYDNAKTACERVGATLPVILNEEVQHKVHALVSDERHGGGRGYYWIGLTDRKIENMFVWLNGVGTSSYRKFHWFYNFNENNKDCVTHAVSLSTNLGTASVWVQKPCNEKHKYVCMKWDTTVRPFQFTSIFLVFNGLYAPEYGNLKYDRPIYVLKNGIDRSKLYFISASNDQWTAKYSGNIFKTFYSMSKAKTPLKIKSVWKRNRFFHLFDPISPIIITAYDKWSQWGAWGPCSLTCGTGYQEKRRICLQPSIDGIYCNGQSKYLQKCNKNACPVVYNPCLPNPCRNGGSCQQDGQKYTCRCRREWGGDRCTQYDPCKQKPCRNDGVCSVVGNSYSCTCTPRWIGRTCSRGRKICFFDESLVSSDVVIEGISGEVHEPGSIFQVGCREPGQHLNALISTMTCRNGGVWAPDYTQFQCS